MLNKDLLAYITIGRIQGTVKCLKWGQIDKDKALEQIIEELKRFEDN